MAAENEQFVASTAPLTFQNFLEKMRHPSASELVKSVKVRVFFSFVHEEVVCQLCEILLQEVARNFAPVPNCRLLTLYPHARAPR